MCSQLVLFARVRRRTSSQHPGKAQEASNRSDGVGQSGRSAGPRRRADVGTASVPASVYVHRLRGRRLARQTAVRAATSRNEPVA